MVILHHQIALGEATTLTLTCMNDQLCLLTPFVSARLTLDSRKLCDLDYIKLRGQPLRKLNRYNRWSKVNMSSFDDIVAIVEVIVDDGNVFHR